MYPQSFLDDQHHHQIENLHLANEFLIYELVFEHMDLMHHNLDMYKIILMLDDHKDLVLDLERIKMNENIT